MATPTIGCWTEATQVDDTFSEAEWNFLASEFRLPLPVRCPPELAVVPCESAASLGHLLFFDKALSGEIQISDPAAAGPKGAVGAIACNSCHDARKPDPAKPRRFLIDTRSQPSNVSSGSKYTRHNALSLVNLGYKAALAQQACDRDPGDSLCGVVFSWDGRYPTPGGVLQLANGPAAMNSSPQLVADAVCSRDAYRRLYNEAFATTPMRCGDAAGDPDDVVATNVALAFDAYVRRFASVNAPFDRYVAGALNADRTTSQRDAISDQARRGLAVFLREGMCIDCHRGPLLTDLKFHNTGVWQTGAHTPPIDDGLATTPPHDIAENRGRFLTPSLRHVAETAPYMHAGQYASLGEVIDFYRRGGDHEGFVGTRDARIEPLDISDDQARDLEAFLRSLTGEDIDAALAEPLP